MHTVKMATQSLEPLPHTRKRRLQSKSESEPPRVSFLFYLSRRRVHRSIPTAVAVRVRVVRSFASDRLESVTLVAPVLIGWSRRGRLWFRLGLRFPREPLRRGLLLEFHFEAAAEKHPTLVRGTL